MTLQERIEQHATGRMGSRTDADSDFASFVVESENLRDAVKVAKPDLEKAVLIAVRQWTSLQLAHDLAIKDKHGHQKSRPWSTAQDVTYVVKISKRIRYSASLFQRRAASTTLLGTPPVPAPGPERWAHQWEIRYTPLSTTLTVDGVQFSRNVIADWRRVLGAFGLM